MYRSCTALLISYVIASISITANNKIQETTLRNSCYYGNYFEINIRKRSKYDVI